MIHIDSQWWIHRYGGFHNWGYPKMDGLYGKIPWTWIIWGYPCFRNPPYMSLDWFKEKWCRIFFIGKNMFACRFPLKPIQRGWKWCNRYLKVHHWIILSYAKLSFTKSCRAMQKTLVVAAWMCKICWEFILSWSNYNCVAWWWRSWGIFDVMNGCAWQG